MLVAVASLLVLPESPSLCASWVARKFMWGRACWDSDNSQFSGEPPSLCTNTFCLRGIRVEEDSTRRPFVLKGPWYQGGCKQGRLPTPSPKKLSILDRKNESFKNFSAKRQLNAFPSWCIARSWRDRRSPRVQMYAGPTFPGCPWARDSFYWIFVAGAALQAVKGVLCKPRSKVQLSFRCNLLPKKWAACFPVRPGVPCCTVDSGLLLGICMANTALGAHTELWWTAWRPFIHGKTLCWNSSRRRGTWSSPKGLMYVLALSEWVSDGVSKLVK